MKRWVLIVLALYVGGLVLILDGMLYIGDSISPRELIGGAPLILNSVLILTFWKKYPKLIKFLSALPLGYFIYIAFSVVQETGVPPISLAQKGIILAATFPIFGLAVVQWKVEAPL